MKSFVQSRCSECGRKKPAPRKLTEKSKAYAKQKLKLRAAARRSRNESTGQIRNEVEARAGGKCEWCRVLVFTSASPMHLHHMEGGSGRRREKQSVKNTAGICRYCHREWHEHPEDPRIQNLVIGFCEREGLPLPGPLRRLKARQEFLEGLRLKGAPKAVSGGD